MSFIEIIGLALGLSMDAFAVSVTNGFMIKQLKFRSAFRIALFFGVFQAVMPVIGWAAGLSFVSYIQSVDHWLAFALLGFIGSKMIVESRSLRKGSECKNCLHLPTLIILSFATSIDALAIGFSFACLRVSIVMPVAFIGGITFLVCLAGVYLGKKVGHIFENKIEMFGGIVLIAIGAKILVEHLVGGYLSSI